MGVSQPITSVSVASNTFVGPLTFTTPGNTVGITSPSALTFAFTATGQPGPTGLQGPAGAAGSNGMGTSGVPGLHFGTTNAAGSSNTAVATDATIALFGTTPTTQAFGDSAVIGTDPLAANALHKHAMPAAELGVLTTEGDLLYRHTGAAARLAIGSNGSILSSNGTDPVWGSGPMSAKGDLIAGATSGAVMRVPVGADTTVLTADSTQATGMKWAAPSGGGSVSALPLPFVQTKTGSGGTLTLNAAPTNGNILIAYGGLNSTGHDWATITQTGVTWTKILGTGSTNPSGSLFIGKVGSGASTAVNASDGSIYWTVTEFTGQAGWTPSLVGSAIHTDSLPHGYTPVSLTSKAVIWIGFATGGTSNDGATGGEGLPLRNTGIAYGVMLPGGLSYYAVPAYQATAFYAEIS